MNKAPPPVRLPPPPQRPQSLTACFLYSSVASPKENAHPREHRHRLQETTVGGIIAVPRYSDGWDYLCLDFKVDVNMSLWRIC